MADESTPASPTPDTPPPRTTGGGFRWEPPTAAELQALMPGYTIEKILGRGGMGAVYRGVQTNLDRPVAIKILPPGVEKEDPSFAERFKSEARLMAKLSHPAVVGVYDFGTNLGGQLYFAMEYVDGSDVAQMIRAQGKLPPEHALAITAHVCDALSAAHELGIVHRDIKPANVLLNMKGQVKVADFGLAKVEEPGTHGLTKTGYAMGTPDFVAPEALMLGTAVDGRADLYALGVMLYQMLTGNIPRGAFKPASVLVPGLDPRFDPIILKAMQHDREERHQSAAELRRELDVILTVPFVRKDAPVSAAIPVAQVAQAPGKRSAAQKPQPRSAGAPTRQPSVKWGEGNRAPETPPKSKTPLFIGLGVAAAIGIGAFVMFSGGKKTPLAAGSDSAPPAKSASVASSTPKPAASTPPTPKPAPTPISTSPSLPISKSSEPQFPPGKWVKVFTKTEDLPEDLRNSGVKFEDGWLRPVKTNTVLRPMGDTVRNGGIRMVIGTKSGLNRSRLQVRHGQTAPNSPNSAYILGCITNETLEFIRYSNGSNRPLLQSELPRLEQGKEYTLELVTVGDFVIARLDGALLGVARDQTLGKGSLNANIWGDLRDIEVINLDGLSEAEALKILGVDEKGNDLRKPAAVAATAPAPSVPASNASRSDAGGSKSPPLPTASSATFPPGQWVKVFSKFEDLPENLRAEVTWEDGWINSKTKPVAWRYPIKMRNGAIRVTSTKNSAFELRVRASLPGDQTYTLMSSNRMTRASSETGKLVHTDLVKGSIPTGDGIWELAVVENRIIGRIHGQIIGFVTDDSISSGHPSIVNGIGRFRDIEVINLDGLPEAEALRILGVDEKGNDLRALAAKQEQQMAEQAKVVDAMAAIPELKALHEQFVKLQAERVTAPFEAELAKLNAGYVGGIDREIANEKKAGHLDGVIALEAEKKLIADKQPVPAEDDEKATEALKKLRGIYRAAHAKLEATRTENLKALTDPLDARLKQIEATLTQQDRIAHAKTVREYREGLGRAAGPPAAASGPAAANTPSTALGGPSALPAKYPKGDDRKAAEWALDLGGTVSIRDGRDTKTISKKDDLPKSSFEVLSIRIRPDSAVKPTIPFTGLAPMAGLRSLEHFETNGIHVTDDDTPILASLPNLRSLTIGFTKQFTGSALSMLKDCAQFQAVNLGSSGLSKQGIEQLGQLNGLISVSISSNELTDDDVAPLRNLKKLTKLHLGRNPLSLEAWRQLKGLPLTSIQYTPEPGRAKEWTKELASLFPAITQSLMVIQEGAVPTVADIEAQAAFPLLKELGVTSSATDDQVLEATSHLSNLHNLEFSSGLAPNPLPITDEGIAHLLNLKSLNRLMLRRTQNLTTAALTTLAKLKSLKTLELAECPQFDDAAIAAFKKERPDVTVKR